MSAKAEGLVLGHLAGDKVQASNVDGRLAGPEMVRAG